MNIILRRTEESAEGIFGAMTDELGNQVCVTLEHAYDSGLGNGTFAPKIPAGTYTCRRRLSPHFGFEVFEVLKVPNCTFIEIHPGNTEKDSIGCILVGTTRQGDAITQSRVAFDKFMELQKGLDSFQLTVQ